MDWLKNNAISLITILVICGASWFGMQTQLALQTQQLTALTKQVQTIQGKQNTLWDGYTRQEGSIKSLNTWAKNTIDVQNAQWKQQNQVNKELLSTLNKMDTNITILNERLNNISDKRR